MLVCYLTDEPSKIPAIRAVLEPHHHIVPRLLGDKVSFGSEGVLMVDADLRVMARVEQIKETLSELHAVSEKLFVVQRHLHHMVAQAYALGATSVVRSTREIAPKLAQIEAAAKASGKQLPKPSDPKPSIARRPSLRCSPRSTMANRSTFRRPRCHLARHYRHRARRA